MRNGLIRPAVVLSAMLCAFLPAKSQNDTLPIWKIEVQGANRPNAGAWSADLYDMHHQRVGTADLNTDSAFIFRDVARGQYRLVVSDPDGAEIYDDILTADSLGPANIIQLPERKRERPPSEGVSVAELQHPPAPKAIRALAAARRFAQSRNYPKAVEELQTAVRISPGYAAAHSMLGAEYARLGRFEEAISESQRAMALGKPNPVDLCNLSYSQALLHRYDEATSSARQCLALAPESPQGHYLLGDLLLRDRQTVPEGLDHLEIAARSLPRARAQLAAARAQLAARGE